MLPARSFETTFVWDEAHTDRYFDKSIEIGHAWQSFGRKIASQKRNAGVLAVIGIGWFFLLMLGYSLWDWFGNNIKFVVELSAFAMMFSIVFWWSASTKQERAVKYARAHAHGTSRTSFGLWRYRISPEGLSTIGPHQETLYRWTDISDCRRDGEWIVFDQPGQRGIVLICTGFTTDAAIDEYVRAAKQWLAESGSDAPARIGRFLSTQKFACPSCHHELAGCDGQRCPECGLKLTLENVPGANDPIGFAAVHSTPQGRQALP